MDQVLYDLPEGWIWKTIGELCHKVTDGSHNPPKAAEDGLPMLSSRNVLNGDIVWDNYRLIPAEHFEREHARTRITEGDVLLTIVGTIGRSTVVRNLSELFTLQRSVAVFGTDALDSDFFSLQLRSSEMQSHLVSNAKGAAQKGIYLKQLKAIYIAYPPISEQKRIVEKLDALLTRINTAIEHLQQSLELADALSKNGLSEIFEGLKVSYDVVPLSSVVKINSGIALPKIFKNGFSDGDIPFFKVAQMNNHHENMVEPEITFNEQIAKEHKIKLFPKGSTLIPKRGGAILTNKKRILLENASYDSNIMGLKADESQITDDYLFAYMRTIDLANFVDASTIPQLNNKHIDQMKIPLASLSEQAEVVNRVDLLVKKVESINIEIQSQLNDLIALKNSTLDSAFKGQL